MVEAGAAPARSWTFLSNHGHLLVALSRDPDARVRDLAGAVGITERAASAILGDLEAAGYITRVRTGRRNSYRLHPERHFRHPAESTHAVGDLLAIFSTGAPSAERGPTGTPAGAG